MHYLKLYIDQDIADISKKRKLMLSKYKKYFVPIKPPRDAYYGSYSPPCFPSSLLCTYIKL